MLSVIVEKSHNGNGGIIEQFLMLVNELLRVMRFDCSDFLSLLEKLMEATLMIEFGKTFLVLEIRALADGMLELFGF